MRLHWITLAPHASLEEAERLMRLARVRHLPVEIDGVLVGLITYREVLQASLARLTGAAAARELPGATPVAAVMDAEPPTANPGDPLEIAAQRMIDAGLGCLPVVERSQGGERRMRGLLVESDLLRCAYPASGVAG
jgi:CBS domain-containing protein